MFRRSAPVLLGLFVCLIAAHLFATADAALNDEALRVDESATRATLRRDSTQVALAFVNKTGRELKARVLVELLDTDGASLAHVERDEQVASGASAIPFTLPATVLGDEKARERVPWYRVRYRITPEQEADSAASAAGIISLSEITPDLFELSVFTPDYVFEGVRFRARVRAAHPFSKRPARGVSISGAFALGDEKKAILLASATTDGEGLATLDFDLPRNVVVNDPSLEVTGRLGEFEQTATDDVNVFHLADILVGTDKPLYQPGQTLHVRALFVDAFAHRVLPDADATLKIRDPDDANVFSAKLHTSRFGVASCDWPIAEGTRLGDYVIDVEMDGGPYENSSGGQRVRVSRYDLPTYVVGVKPDKSFYLPGEDAVVEVRADYLFGEPVKRGHVRVVRETEREWNFKEQQWDTDEGETYEGEADAEGRFVAHVNLADAHHRLSEDDNDNTRFKDLNFAAYFTDPTTNRTEQRRFDLRVTREPIHLYVVGKDYSGNAANFPVEFYVTAFYADGTPARAAVAISEDEARADIASTNPRPGSLVRRTLQEVKTNRFGLAKVSRLSLTPNSDDGESRAHLKLVARDAEGRTGTATESFDLDGDTAIRVETDKTIYNAGEPVRAEITSNVSDRTLVVDVLRDNAVISSRTVRLRGGRAELFIPYRKEFRDEMVVAAYTLSDYGDDDRTERSARAVLFPHARALQFDVRLDRREYKPGDDARAEVRVRDASGREVESALGAVITDRAVEERERTDREFGSGRGFGGFAGFVHDRLGESESLAGVTRRSLDQLDLSKPLPEGLDLLAEIMLNRNIYVPSNTFGEGFTRDQHKVFLAALDKQLKPVRDALDARYARSGEYPRDETTLRRTLSDAGVELDALRDPWGVPYRLRFGTEQDKDTVEVVSAAADKRAETGDDFVALKDSWPYFRPTGEIVERVFKEHFQRTRHSLQDRATLESEMLGAGVDFDKLRDRWGKPYDVRFETVGREFQLRVISGGPDGRFASENKKSYDDFTVWTARADYFAGAEKRIQSAIDESIASGHSFPKNEAELRDALRRAGVDESTLLDAWGHPYVLSFSEHDWYPGRVVIRSYARYGEKPKERAETLPVKRKLYAVVLRSNGEDAKPSTQDDIQIANLARVLDTDAPPTQTTMPTNAAQTSEATSGVLSGTLTDPNGAVIPSAKVLCKNNATGEVRETKTNEDGYFAFDELPTGTYEITFASAGFVSLVLTEVPVTLAKVTDIEVQLQPGAVTETVTVTAEAATVETTSADSAQITEQKLENLPTNGRNYLSFALLKHGIVNIVTKSGVTETPRLREYFPETLLWEPSLETDAGGRASLRFKLADNITTWKLSVVGSTLDGQLGYAEKGVRAFQPFFVEHDPPRVLTEGDEIQLPVVLRNYLARAQDVRLELKPESWFALLGPAEKRATVQAGDAARETFDFRAVAVVKDGKQRVTAYGSDDSDAVERTTSVHPDGEEVSEAASQVFKDSGSLEVNFPASTIPATARAELRIYPNLLSHVVEGVEGILRRPYGCAEQTISSTYPSLLILRRYKQSGGELPPVARKADAYLRAGYERLLGMRDSDGGITYWGRGGDADTALTAYALKFLTDARGTIDVDADLAGETRDWLVKHQRADGAWPAQEWQAKDEQRTVLLTTYVARILAESGVKPDAAVEKKKPGDGSKMQGAVDNEKQSNANESVVTSGAGANSNQSDENAKASAALRRALDFLRPRIENSDDSYLLASFTLAASALGERESASKGARRLLLFGRDEGEGSYWEIKGSTPFYGWGLAGRIETTALAVRALSAECRLRNVECGLKEGTGDAATNLSSNPQSQIRNQQLINRGLNFLLRHEDDFGVWYSTQATVNVLDTLAALSPRGASKAAVNTSTSATQTGDTAEVFVNSRHATTIALSPTGALAAPVVVDLAPFINSPGPNRVEIRRAQSSALASAQVASAYYVPWADSPAARDEQATNAPRIRIGFDRTEGEAGQPINCTVEVERGRAGYGMLLAEVGLPPGTEVDRASLESARQDADSHLYGYDVLPDRLVLYLWPYGNSKSRFTFKLTPRYGIRALTAPSKVYDYYNPEARTVVPPTRFVIR
jgi:hypothetical protein